MAVAIIEPHAMAMSRSTMSDDSQDKDNIDYRMLPRSSGDGMEHAGNHSEPSSSALHSLPGHQSYKTSPIDTYRNSDITSQKYSIQSSDILSSENKTSITDDVHKPHVGTDTTTYHRKNSSDYTRKNTFKSHEDLLSSRDETGTSISLSNSLYDTSYLEDELFDFKKESSLDDYDHRKATLERTISNDEVFEMQNNIKDLEERNAKLVEDKTKLCVQLGLQTEVNAELKRLVVAAVGEDLENSLEALLMRNAQAAVEIKHWKQLSEEYAEESDKLAIECDVWRTKFMASRMMSDELSTWKTTLYTKYKQTQSALQRILNEREELKKHLIKTKRLLHIHNEAVTHDSASYKHTSSENLSDHYVGQQSVLELASVINCLVQDLTTNIFGDIQNTSLPEEVLAEDSSDKQKVEPTPGEKLAIQVLTSDVELQTDEQPDNSAVMKRLGKQYIGNSYHSRLMTNSFRVTYDCCDRCKGAVQVV